MLDKKDFQVGSVFIYNNKIVVIDEDELEVIMAVRNYDDFKPIRLTHAILENNLGFEVFDMGEFWQAELEDILLVQPRSEILPGNLAFVMGFKITEPQALSFLYVHHLQLFFYALKGRELSWKPDKY